MAIVKSLSVGNGDLFYIEHDSDNFTIIDCNLPSDRRETILNELEQSARNKSIRRFISTHPDEDHIHGIEHIDKAGLCENFYCVQNSIRKYIATPSFLRYSDLRSHATNAYYIYKDCKRLWMNQSNNERQSAGINILWPDINDAAFLEELHCAEKYVRANNICPIIQYSFPDGAVFLWMGDLEKEFMEEIAEKVNVPRADILFAPHHGRSSGRVPKKWLDTIDPQIIVIGEAPSEELAYYRSYNTITQNKAGDIEFDCSRGLVDVRVSSCTYTADFLDNKPAGNRIMPDGTYMWHIGSMRTHCQPQ